VIVGQVLWDRFIENPELVLPRSIPLRLRGLSLASLLSVALGGCQVPWRPWETVLFDGPGVSLAGTAKSSRNSHTPIHAEIILGSTQASSMISMAALKMMDLAKENNNSSWLGENWSLTIFPVTSRRSIETYCKEYRRGIYNMVVSTQPVPKDLLALCARHGVPPLIEIPIANSAIAFVVADNNPFAQSLQLERLAQILPKAGSQLLWSDLDPRWPRTSLRIGWNGASAGDILFGAWTTNRPSHFLGIDDPLKLLDSIAADPTLLGVVTYNTLLEAQDRGIPVRALAVGEVQGDPVPLADATVMDGTYPTRLHLSVRGLATREAMMKSCFSASAVAVILNPAYGVPALSNYLPLRPNEYAKALAVLHAAEPKHHCTDKS